MLTRDSIASVDPASLASLADCYLGRMEIELPRYEAISVVHWSYAELFETPVHFWRRSQSSFPNFNGDFSQCFGLTVEAFSCAPLTDKAVKDVLRECLDGNPLFDAALRDLGPFHWGTSLYDDWDRKIAVSRFGNLYLAAYWETYA